MERRINHQGSSFVAWENLSRHSVQLFNQFFFLNWVTNRFSLNLCNQVASRLSINLLFKTLIQFLIGGNFYIKLFYIYSYFMHINLSYRSANILTYLLRILLISVSNSRTNCKLFTLEARLKHAFCMRS